MPETFDTDSITMVVLDGLIHRDCGHDGHGIFSFVIVSVCYFRTIIDSQPFHVNRALSMKWGSNASGCMAINMYSLWTLWLTAFVGKARKARIKKPQEEKQDMNDGIIP